jgi:hypothetical protein
LSWLTLAGAAMAQPQVLVVPSFGDPVGMFNTVFDCR